MIYNSENFYTKEATVESFFDGLYSPVKNSFISYLKLEDGDDNKVLLSQEDSSMQGSQQDKKVDKKLKNTAEILLFKEGKKLAVLDEDFLENLNLVLGGDKKQNIIIDDEENSQKTVFYIDKKSIAIDTKIKNNIPIFSVFTKLYLSRVEVLGEQGEIKYNLSYNDIDDDMQKKIEKKVKEEFSKVVEMMKENKSDLLGVYYNFYRNNRKDFKKYLLLLEDKYDFLDNIIFELKVRVVPD